MRSLLSSGIKAILAVAALSVAAHWTLRLQREPIAPVAVAAIPDPVSTGSIEPRKSERAVEAPKQDFTKSFDQDHLSKLISNASVEKPKAQKAVAKR